MLSALRLRLTVVIRDKNAINAYEIELNGGTSRTNVRPPPLWPRNVESKPSRESEVCTLEQCCVSVSVWASYTTNAHGWWVVPVWKNKKHETKWNWYSRMKRRGDDRHGRVDSASHDRARRMMPSWLYPCYSKAVVKWRGKRFHRSSHHHFHWAKRTCAEYMSKMSTSIFEL